MRKILVVLSWLPLLALAGCPVGPSIPTATEGGGWFINTGYVSEGLITYAPYTTITGGWVSDGAGALGDPSTFVVSTDSTALAEVVNGRVPASWKVVWSASLSFPECDGYTTIAMPTAQGRVDEINCYVTTVSSSTSNFVLTPNPVNLAAPGSTSHIQGSGFTSNYGMPLVQYFSLAGALVSQARATYVAPNGTSISAPMPSLAGLPVGAYAGIISNVGSNGQLVYVGSVSASVVSTYVPPCQTLRSPDGLNPCPPGGNK
jgi:hypothetical protein